MNRNRMAAISLVLMLAMVAVAVRVAALVPDGASLPVHWDFNGHPNGFAGKWVALLIPVAVTAAVSLLFYFLPSIEPREKHLQRSQGLVLAAWGGLLLFNIVLELTIISGALNWNFPVMSVMLVAVGLFFVLVGNQLGKSRSMYFVGIRTPWTLSSEQVWIKTHRLAGKLMVAGGVVMATGGFLPVPGGAVPMLVIAIVAVMAGVPIVYSYLVWRREQTAGQTNG